MVGNQGLKCMVGTQRWDLGLVSRLGPRVEFLIWELGLGLHGWDPRLRSMVGTQC